MIIFSAISNFFKNTFVKSILNDAYDSLLANQGTIIDELDNLAIKKLQGTNLPFLEGKSEQEVKDILRLICKSVTTAVVLALVDNGQVLISTLYAKLKA